MFVSYFYEDDPELALRWEEEEITKRDKSQELYQGLNTETTISIFISDKR